MKWKILAAAAAVAAAIPAGASTFEGDAVRKTVQAIEFTGSVHAGACSVSVNGASDTGGGAASVPLKNAFRAEVATADETPAAARTAFTVQLAGCDVASIGSVRYATRTSQAYDGRVLSNTAEGGSAGTGVALWSGASAVTFSGGSAPVEIETGEGGQVHSFTHQAAIAATGDGDVEAGPVKADLQLEVTYR